MLDISVIVLTFGRLDYTKDCIESFLATAPENYELLVVDNGSTDGTIPYLKELEANNSRVRLFLSSENLYPCGGYKKGLELVSPAKCYMICDNDGFFDKEGWYETSMKFLNKFPDVGILGLRRSQWEKHIFEKEEMLEYEGEEYVYSHGIAAHTLITEKARKILVEQMKGKWIGNSITRIIQRKGKLKSIKLHPGLVYDMSETDLDNPKYRDMYLEFWKTKGRLGEFERRVKILNKDSEE